MEPTSPTTDPKAIPMEAKPADNLPKSGNGSEPEAKKEEGTKKKPSMKEAAETAIYMGRLSKAGKELKKKSERKKKKKKKKSERKKMKKKEERK